MLSQTVNKFLRHIGSGLTFTYRNATSSVLSNLDKNQLNTRDPAPYFFDKEVQQLLTDLTRVEDKIVFRERKDGKPCEPPQYKFMTDKDLQAAISAAHTVAKKVLQMPPVVQQRMEINKILDTDTALQGYDRSKYVFTDISFGIKDRDRLIAVREPNGQLRLANWNERERIRCIYFGIDGREMEIPAMFGQKQLGRLLEQGKYLFALNRACLQFEPDDPRYHRIVTKVYDCVNAKKDYQQLRSTRHFGPMVFYLVWNNMMDDLIIDVLENERVSEAVSLIRLFTKIHSFSIRQQETFKNIHDDIQYIEYYCKHYAVKGEMIADVLRMYLTTKEHEANVAMYKNEMHDNGKPSASTS